MTEPARVLSLTRPRSGPSREFPAADSARTAILAVLTSPLTLSRVVFGTGLMTVLSAASPAVHGRLTLVTDLLPGSVPAAAATAALAFGTLMMVLSRAVRRGKFRAWLLCTVLAGSAVVLDLVKGLDVEEAAVTAVLLALLLRARPRFNARPDPRSHLRVAGVALVGPLVATLLGWIWLSFDVDGQAPGTTWTARLQSALTGLVGIQGPVHYVTSGSRNTASIGLGVLGAAVLLALLLAAVRPATGPHHLTDDEDDAVRNLNDLWGGQDSLSYFATRRDRSLKLSPNGQAGITYRVVGTVSLAAGDPVGNPTSWPEAIWQWLAECAEYGWTPAVLGAGEHGAEAYRRAGLDALELGDEAVIDIRRFTLAGREMRGVRQAVARCRRAGLTARVVRVADLTEEQRAGLRYHAETWRDGSTERGFSMALGRFVSEDDPEAVLVLAYDSTEQLRGVLSLVPWGNDGLSLDLMRRDHSSANGIIELMVAHLCDVAPDLGVRRVSLNFAVFRSVFARTDRIGAGPVLRLWSAVLRFLSRFWQIESLYRSNTKYRPAWVPRFVCFRRASDLPRIGAAALRAEAFLALPPWLSPVRRAEAVRAYCRGPGTNVVSGDQGGERPATSRDHGPR